MTRKDLMDGQQFKFTTTSWHLRISVKQLKTILAITRGYHRFAMNRLGAEDGDAERMQLMKKAAVRGDLRVSYEEKPNRHNNFYFYFDRDYYDSTGKNIRGEHCISQWENASPYFSEPADVDGWLPRNVPTFGEKTSCWKWLKKYLKLK